MIINRGFKFTPVIVIAGQSNAQGNTPFIADMPSEFLGQDTNYVSNDGGSIITMAAKANNVLGIGQEFGLTYYMSQQRHQSVYVVKYSYGGTRLTVNGQEWNSNGGALYLALMAALSSVLTTLSSQHKNPKVVSFILHLGESDAIAQVSQGTYYTELHNLINAWRNHSLNTYYINGDNVNVQVMRIHNSWQTAYGGATISSIRAAQEEAAAQISNVQVVNIDDLATKPGDPIHLTTASQCTLSARTFENIKWIRPSKTLP